MRTTNKVKALMKFLETDKDSAEYEISRENYLVLTDQEADQRAREYILESIWAFNSEFLAGHCGLDASVIKAIQYNGKCEDNNEVIIKLIDDIDHFIDDAILSDGRGHFISTYDGQENEIQIGKKLYFIYRQN